MGSSTIDTLWAGESISKKISASGYNFLRASIYPVCVYFKDGSIWGESSAEYDEIVENSREFKGEHYAFGLSRE